MITQEELIRLDRDINQYMNFDIPTACLALGMVAATIKELQDKVRAALAAMNEQTATPGIGN